MADLKEKRKTLLVPYVLPPFYNREAHEGKLMPTHRLNIANLPTPIQPFPLPELPEDVAVDVKRDDFSGGIEMTGNKIRKLEFIMADAVHRGVDVIFSAGGTQSNHARATAAACAKLFHLPCHLFLRKDNPGGKNGNFFLDRMLGAHIHEITAEEQAAFVKETPDWVEHKAEEYGALNDCLAIGVPIGGSNTYGAWGYINAVHELSRQLDNDIEWTYSDLVACTGSGGTLAGLGVGVELYSTWKHLSGSERPKVHTFSVCDSPDYFHDYITKLTRQVFKGPDSRDLMTIHDAKGLGYAKSTTEELQFISRVARETGLILDFCYTGKTVLGLWNKLKTKEIQPSKKLLYIHTGGGPSLFDRLDLFDALLPATE